jgi:eukaryotic-like serine/threonine-protein kinase
MAATTLFPRSGDKLRMKRAGALVVTDEQVAEGGQGVVYRAHLESGGMVAVKWYRPSPYLEPMRRAILNLAGHNRPHPSFAWPLDLVESADIEGFGYVMAYIPSTFRSLVSLLAAKEQPSFRRLTAIGRELVDAFAALHGAGLSYRDISFGNLLVNPDTGDVAIVDNDNIGVDTSEGYVRGTLRFMAPEVLRYETTPSTTSDLYSLAVFLFYLLVHGHPLEGEKVESSYSCGNVSETDVIVRYFGQEPLFVFDPDDPSNRPLADDPMVSWWGIYPKFMRELFTQAFTVGLHDASLSGRILEGTWRRALVRLSDSVNVCSCRAEVFWDPDEPEKRCWNCGELPPVPMILALRRSTIVLAPGATVCGHHLANDRDFRGLKAVVEPHPHDRHRVVMRNLSAEDWVVRPVGEEEKLVQPGQRLAVRPMEIELGQVGGTIRSAAPELDHNG